VPPRPTLHIGRAVPRHISIGRPGPPAGRADDVGPAPDPRCELPWMISSPSSSASRRATPPWHARGSPRTWYRIARRPDRSRGRLLLESAPRNRRKAEAIPLTRLSLRPHVAPYHVYAAPLLRFDNVVEQTGPVHTYLAGARCSTGAEIWIRLRIVGYSAHACSESRTTLPACQARAVYCRQFAEA
jgi:hypothetical protein